MIYRFSSPYNVTAHFQDESELKSVGVFYVTDNTITTAIQNIVHPITQQYCMYLQIQSTLDAPETVYTKIYVKNHLDLQKIDHKIKKIPLFMINKQISQIQKQCELIILDIQKYQQLLLQFSFSTHKNNPDILQQKDQLLQFQEIENQINQSDQMIYQKSEINYSDLADSYSNLQLDSSLHNSQSDYYNSDYDSDYSSYQSLINYDYNEQNPVAKWLSTITKNQNLPIVYKANKNMRQSIFENTNNIIFYLAANRNKFSHIAKHFTRHQSILRKNGLQHSKDRSFLFLVEKGDQNYSNYSAQSDLVYYLWENGFKYVIEWIISIGKGISQLEQFGIFHREIYFRNTIKIGELFKIIDFDLAFVVRKCSQLQGNNKAYKSTKEIIKIWLRSNKQEHERQQNFVSYMFHDLQDNKTVKRILDLKQNVQFDTVQATSDQIMKLLQIHMHKSHLQQFIDLITGPHGLISDKLIEQFKHRLGNDDNILYRIKYYVDQLKNGLIGYKPFCRRLQEIKFSLQEVL